MVMRYTVEHEGCRVMGCPEDVQARVMAHSSWEAYVYGRYCLRHARMVCAEMNGRAAPRPNPKSDK